MCENDMGTYLDSIQAVVCHVHAQENSATCAPAQVLDHYILIYKGAASQLSQLQTAVLPMARAPCQKLC